MSTYIPGVEDYIPQAKPFTPDYKFLSDEVDKLTSQKGIIKVGDRNIPITSQTEALLPQEYRTALGNIKNYALSFTGVGDINIKLIDECGHMAHTEHPNEVNAIIKDTISK